MTPVRVLVVDDSVVVRRLVSETLARDLRVEVVGTAANETYNGRGGNDSLMGNWGNDRLNGGSGFDYVMGEGAMTDSSAGPVTTI